MKPTIVHFTRVELSVPQLAPGECVEAEVGKWVARISCHTAEDFRAHGVIVEDADIAYFAQVLHNKEGQPECARLLVRDLRKAEAWISPTIEVLDYVFEE